MIKLKGNKGGRDVELVNQRANKEKLDAESQFERFHSEIMALSS
jgi:hypothetical protein